MEKKTSRVVTVKLPHEMFERLDRLSKETKRPKAFFMKLLLEEHLEELEDIYLAEATIEAVRAGKEKLYTLEEAEEKFGL